MRLCFLLSMRRVMIQKEEGKIVENVVGNQLWLFRSSGRLLFGEPLTPANSLITIIVHTTKYRY